MVRELQIAVNNRLSDLHCTADAGAVNKGVRLGDIIVAAFVGAGDGMVVAVVGVDVAVAEGCNHKIFCSNLISHCFIGIALAVVFAILKAFSTVPLSDNALGGAGCSLTFKILCSMRYGSFSGNRNQRKLLLL